MSDSPLKKLMPRVIELLEFDANSYNLSAMFAIRKSSLRAFKGHEKQRRDMITKIQDALKSCGEA